jgi:hypothetical protein
MTHRMSPFFFAIVFVFALLQSFIGHLPLPWLKLDLIALAVLYLGFYVPLFPGGILVFLIALAEETLGAPFHGTLLTAYLGVYIFLRLTHQNLFFQRRTSQVIWVALLSLAVRGLESALLAWQGYETPSQFGALAAWALLEGLASVAVFPLLKIGGKMESRYAS